MDKIEQYKKILTQVLEKQAAIPYANAKGLKNHLVIDEKETEFVLLKLGWIDGLFKHGVVFHFQIKNQKVWLYKNNTDVEIGEELVQRGIPKSDIVIGFVSEMERTVEGYALA